MNNSFRCIGAYVVALFAALIFSREFRNGFPSLETMLSWSFLDGIAVTIACIFLVFKLWPKDEDEPVETGFVKQQQQQ